MFLKYLIAFITVILVVDAHPYFQQQYQELINKDRCLKGCMDTVTAYGEELSLLKNTQLKDYFNSHDTKCNVIKTAQKCVNDCQIESNPFNLEVMLTHCSNDTYEKVAALDECFDENGDKINDYCKSNCGDYKEIKDEIHELTRNLNQYGNPARITDEILEKSNQACGVYKCMQRCNIDQANQLCGQDKAEILQSLIQDILNAQRSDIERLNVLQTMVKTTPKQCDYMYNPETLFGSSSTSSEVQSNSDQEQEDDPTNAINELQVAVLTKQLQVLEKQEKVLEKEDGKLDLEISVLQQKATAEALKMQQRQFY